MGRHAFSRAAIGSVLHAALLALACSLLSCSSSPPPQERSAQLEQHVDAGQVTVQLVSFIAGNTAAQNLPTTAVARFFNGFFPSDGTQYASCNANSGQPCGNQSAQPWVKTLAVGPTTLAVDVRISLNVIGVLGGAFSDRCYGFTVDTLTGALAPATPNPNNGACTGGTMQPVNGMVECSGDTCTFKSYFASVSNGIPTSGEVPWTTTFRIKTTGCVPTSSIDGCDGKDNDCDGQTDEDFVPTSVTCGPPGACSGSLTLNCSNGSVTPSACTGVSAPTPEVFDGKDNDCDGQTDECDPAQPLQVTIDPNLVDASPAPFCQPLSATQPGICSLRGAFQLADQVAANGCSVNAFMPAGKYRVATELKLARGHLRLFGADSLTTSVEPTEACPKLCATTCANACHPNPPPGTAECPASCDPSCNTLRDPRCVANETCKDFVKHRLVNVSADAGQVPALEVSNLAFRGGRNPNPGFDPDADGGGIFVRSGSFSASRMLLENNWASAFGAGIAIEQSVATITDSVIRNNVSEQTGSSCVANGTFQGGGCTSRGGGVFALDSSVLIERSSILGNVSSDGGGIAAQRLGNLTIRNSTISGNSAPGRGAGILTEIDTTLEFDTIAFNTGGNNAGSAENDRGAGIAADAVREMFCAAIDAPAPTLRAFGNIIAGNRLFNGVSGHEDCNIQSGTPGWIVQAGFNLIPSALDCPALLANGGLTGAILQPGFDTVGGQLAQAFVPDAAPGTSAALNYALAANSAASSAYPAGATPACPLDDQRRGLRPVGSACDLGAVELGALADADFDFIADPVDPQPATFSNDFSDSPNLGLTSGTISDRGRHNVSVRDAANLNDGVVISVASDGGTNPVKITACNGSVQLSLQAGQSQTVTCPPAPHSCLFASQALTVKDRSSVMSDAFGASVALGFDSVTSGNLFSSGSAFLDERSTVTQNATLAGTLTGNRAGVKGVLSEHAAVAAQSLSLRGGTSSGADIEVPFNGLQTLHPGSSGDVLVHAGATLRLAESGLYRFKSLVFEPDTHLSLTGDQRLTALGIDGTLTFGDRLKMDTNGGTRLAPGQVLFYASGTAVTVGFDTALTGTLEAPFATVALQDRAIFSGCVAGKIVDVGFDATVGGAAPSPLCDATNLVQNAGFESTTNDWLASPGATFGFTTARAHTGARSGSVTARTSATQGALQSLLSRAPRASTFDVSAWAEPSTSTTQPLTLTAHVRCNGAPDQQLTIASGSGKNTAWTRLAGTLTVPNCALGALELSVQGPPAGVGVFVDDVAAVQRCQ